jgi:hypothetical protein
MARNNEYTSASMLMMLLAGYCVNLIALFALAI